MYDRNGQNGFDNDWLYDDYPRGKRRRRREGGIGGRLAALCICCVLLGGIISGAVFYGLSARNKIPDTPVPGGITSSSPTNAVRTYSSNTGETYTATDIYYNYAPAVVGITTEQTSTTNVFGQTSTATVSGSGFIISEDGYVLTNAHVVDGAANVTVTTIDGNTYKAELIGYDSDYEVGVLKIDPGSEKLDCVVIGSIDNMLVGEAVYVIGNPLGELTYSITSGIISALDREINIDGSAINMFQISAAVNFGNSGGPVFNKSGEVVGIVTAKSSAAGVEGLGFAITIDDAMNVAQDLIVNGYVTGKPYFGIVVENLDSATISYYDLPRGVLVKSVDSGSCSDKAGIVAGDIITALDGREVTDTDTLASAKKKFSAGDTTTVTVYRNGEYVKLEITFDEMPAKVPQP